MAANLYSTYACGRSLIWATKSKRSLFWHMHRKYIQAQMVWTPKKFWLMSPLIIAVPPGFKPKLVWAWQDNNILYDKPSCWRLVRLVCWTVEHFEGLALMGRILSNGVRATSLRIRVFLSNRIWRLWYLVPRRTSRWARFGWIVAWLAPNQSLSVGAAMLGSLTSIPVESEAFSNSMDSVIRLESPIVLNRQPEPWRAYKNCNKE